MLRFFQRYHERVKVWKEFEATLQGKFLSDPCVCRTKVTSSPRWLTFR